MLFLCFLFCNCLFWLCLSVYMYPGARIMFSAFCIKNNVYVWLEGIIQFFENSRFTYYCLTADIYVYHIYIFYYQFLLLQIKIIWLRPTRSYKSKVCMTVFYVCVFSQVRFTHTKGYRKLSRSHGMGLTLLLLAIGLILIFTWLNYKDRGITSKFCWYSVYEFWQFEENHRGRQLTEKGY